MKIGNKNINNNILVGFWLGDCITRRPSSHDNCEDQTAQQCFWRKKVSQDNFSFISGSLATFCEPVQSMNSSLLN